MTDAMKPPPPRGVASAGRESERLLHCHLMIDDGAFAMSECFSEQGVANEQLQRFKLELQLSDRPRAVFILWPHTSTKPSLLFCSSSGVWHASVKPSGIEE